MCERLHVVCRAAFYVDKLSRGVFNIGTAGQWFYAYRLCCGQVRVVHIVEGTAVLHIIQAGGLFGPLHAWFISFRITAAARCNQQGTLEEAKALQDQHGGYIKTMWCGDLECELAMKEKAGMSSRCIPFAQEKLGETCACCGKPADKMIYWGVAY